jgi:hypothetical protein
LHFPFVESGVQSPATLPRVRIRLAHRQQKIPIHCSKQHTST